MLWVIMRKELVDHVSSLRFSAIFILTLLLMVTSVMVFSGTYENAVKAYPRRVAGLVNEDGTTYLSNVPCQGGATVQRVPSPLAFCSGAGERELPNQAIFAVHGLQAIRRIPALGEILTGSAHLDWAFVITVLLSFAAGLLTYKGISGELRDGTLTLMLSNPVSRGTVFLGKYLAALLALAACLAIAMMFSLLVLQGMGAVHFRGDDWLKLGLAGLTSLFYLSLFILIGMLCSVFARSPLLSAVAFLFTWTCLVFVIPNLSGILAGLVEDIETPLQVKETARAIPDRFPLNPGMSALEIASVKLQRELARERLLREYIQSLIRQVETGQSLSRLSPASTFSYAVQNIVGDGTYRLMRFVDNTVRFREGFFQAMLEADRQDPESEHYYIPWSCGGRNFSRRVVDLGPAKTFQDPPPSSLEGLQAAFIDLALLILYNALLFFISFWGFTRQDVAPTPGV